MAGRIKKLPISEEYQQFLDRFKRAISKRGSQGCSAKVAGVSRQTINNWTSGRTDINVRTLLSFIGRSGITVSDLFGEPIEADVYKRAYEESTKRESEALSRLEAKVDALAAAESVGSGNVVAVQQ